MKYKASKKSQKSITHKRVIYPVEEGINSEASKKQYRWHFNDFLKYSELTEERLCQLGERDPRELERIIIRYLKDHKYKEKNLKHSTINTAMHAILHFCDMNYIDIPNKRRISKLSIPSDEDHQKDRGYSNDEILELLNKSGERMKVIILLMASTGMKVGAIPGLELRDLSEFPPENSDIKIDTGGGYPKPKRIEVYARSKKYSYYTFCTPECAKAIDVYLKFRKGHHEDITKGDSPLIREEFNVDSKSDAANPRKITLPSLNKLLERTIEKAGIKNTHDDKSAPKVMRSHGFRKFAITQMIKSKVDYEVREYLVGHRASRGLDVNYDRSEEEDRFEEWYKAVDLLTINEEYRVKKKLQKIEGEYEKKLYEYDQQIAELRKRVQYLGEGFKDVTEQRNASWNRTDKNIKTSMDLLHLAVKKGVLSDSEAKDWLNKILHAGDISKTSTKREKVAE